MNDQPNHGPEDSHGSVSPNPAPRPPVNPGNADAPPPPPPPPPPGYGYPYPAPQPGAGQPRGLVANISKLGALLSFGFVIFFAGFYLALFSFTSKTGPTLSTYREGTTDGRIAIIPIDGVIMGSKVSFIRRVVDRVVEDKTIKAVIVRVESPGGGVTASDQILHQLKRIREKRGKDFPVIGSYGAVAASGGYYVSCLCDPIYCEPTTITGSIGVIGEVFTFQELLEDKLGVKTEVITSTGSPEKDTANNMFRTWTDKDRKVMRDMLDTMYGQFVDVVHENRGRVFAKREDVLKVATGRIYTAKDAVGAGLVDEIGYLDAVIEKAENMAGLTKGEAPVVVYSEPATFGSLFGMRGPDNNGSAGSTPPQQINAATVRQWMTELGVPEMMYMMQVAH
ncbi:MAG: signal peptide peptidase SppA [Phycisphaera sp.]|nr:signal peptide peptidase SppA [Phycisphaera sp.]